MTITAIEDKGRGKRLISLNDSPAFILKISEVSHYGLREGAELTDEVYERLLEEVLIKRAKSRTLHILDSRDKTEKELRDRLEKDLYPQEAIDAAVEAAKSGRFLDDERYASQYIYEKSGKKSERQIRIFLEGKGIGRDIIDRAVDEVRSGFEETKEDPERDLILKLINKRCQEPSALDNVEKQKLIRFLLSKGFEYDKIRKYMV